MYARIKFYSSFQTYYLTSLYYDSVESGSRFTQINLILLDEKCELCEYFPLLVQYLTAVL